MSIAYLEQPTTEGFNRRRTNNLINPQNPDDFLTDPGQAERYIAERFDWSLSLAGRRTDFRADVFSEIRSGRFNAQGELLEDQAQRGISARFSWQAGTRTTFILNGSLINRELDEQSEDDFLTASVAAEYRLGGRTTLTLSQAYTNQDPGESGGARGFTSNVTTLSLRVTL